MLSRPKKTTKGEDAAYKIAQGGSLSSLGASEVNVRVLKIMSYVPLFCLCFVMGGEDDSASGNFGFEKP